MLTADDLSAINPDYFQIIDSNRARIVIMSRNTGHYWCLLERLSNGCRSFQIQHRHGNSGPYHVQRNRPSIEDCCDYIIDHDFFHLERERAKREKRERSLERRKAVQQRTQRG